MSQGRAWDIIEDAGRDIHSSIRIYLNCRREWIIDGNEGSFRMMLSTVPYLSQREYDAVKALGEMI
jgi:hypothetical protein